MEHAQLESAVTDIVRDLAEVDTLVLDTDMAAADLPGWDSFTHVEFIAALEDRFEVQLSLTEVEAWATIGDVLLTLQRHIAALRG